MRNLLSVLLGLLSAVSGCGQYRPSGEVPRETDLAVAVPREDASIEAAVQQARETLDRFIKRLSAPGPGEGDFSIKVAVQDGEVTHHMWLQDVAFEGSRFRGILGPDAAGMKIHGPGERVDVDRSSVEDWMYVAGGKLVGGFSLRAIREKLSGTARERFDKSMWFKFD